MKERIVFMLENKDDVAVSHSFFDIKMQKISPEGKPKIQLQLVLQDGNNNSTFHFVNKKGTQYQVQDREKVKELIQSILPNFKRKIDTELEQKNKILTENPKLLQLYKDLVISRVLTSEEFWAIHGKELQDLKSAASKQEIGVSGSFLSEIKPITDGCNGFKYNLTAEVIESVFKAYPAVKKKHQECVPTKLSESEFWTKFFQSHYFHRDRITTGIKDVFVECGKIDDSTLKRDIRRNMDDPLLNLTKFGDNTIDDGFCSSSTSEQQKQDNTGNIVHQSIIKRFNQHSFMILKTCKDQSKELQQQQQQQQASIEKASPEEKKNGTQENKRQKAVEEILPIEDPHEAQLRKKQRIAEKIQYDDLGASTSNVSQSVASTSINLDKLERYLYGPMPTAMEHTSSNKKEYSIDAIDQTLRRNSVDWGQRITHKQLINPTAAVNALGELSPGGVLMSGYQDHNLSQFIPLDVEKELSNLYLSAGELLKEFWSCYPPLTTELESKASKMHDTLQRFNSSKIKPFEDKIIRDLAPLGSQLVSHLNLLLDTAFRKYNSWNERKGKK
jgi:transcription initiation factor TFIIH subunit 1